MPHRQPVPLEFRISPPVRSTFTYKVPAQSNWLTGILSFLGQQRTWHRCRQLPSK
jgi:hypothetical protein